MRVLTLADIKSAIDLPTIITLQEQGFQAFSAGKVDVPPVGYLQQYTPPGSYHIKYGLIKEDKFWVLKIAGGPDALPLNGMMLAMSTATGKPIALLQDEGYLTQLRTAVAGLIAAKYLAPKTIKAIGIIGTGEQARLQLAMLKQVTTCREVYVWGRSAEKMQAYQQAMVAEGFNVKPAPSVTELAKHCNLIITTTTAKQPIFPADAMQAGTHITAVGADDPSKTELEPELLKRADVICVDSQSQCIDHGEIQQACQQGLIRMDDLVELGDVIANNCLGRVSDEQITVADLTGVAVQDIQIVKAILAHTQEAPN